MNTVFANVDFLELLLYTISGCAICSSLYFSRMVMLDIMKPLKMLGDLPDSFFYSTGAFFVSVGCLGLLSENSQFSSFMILLAMLSFLAANFRARISNDKSM